MRSTLLAITVSIIMAALALLMGVIASPAWALTQNEIQKLLASDGAAGNLFGITVAVDGDTAVIGALLDDDAGANSGSAYVFTRDEFGIWSQQAKLTASDGAAIDRFGISVAVDGDTAVIGAFFDDDGGANSGSAYVFARSAGMWTEQAKLTASDAAAADRFGRGVAVDGDTAVIGASLGDGSVFASGSAYVFTRDEFGIWSQRAKLTASDGAAIDRFGISVAVDGDTAVIGALLDDDAGANSGSAYVFTRSAGMWTEDLKLIASDAAAGDQFGISVAVGGDTAVIGAFFDDDGGANSGSAYVFARSAGMWTEQAKLTASDAAAADRFGISVAVDGNTAVIGAFLGDGIIVDSGSAYVFTRSAGMWTEELKLTASDAAASDRFGRAVAVDGNTAVIGAFLGDDGGADSGSAYVFAFNPAIAATEALIATIVEMNFHHGISNALDAKLNAVIQVLDDVNQNNDVAAINVLVAFIQMVEAQRGKKITNAQADELVAAAQAIIDLLSL